MTESQANIFWSGLQATAYTPPSLNLVYDGSAMSAGSKEAGSPNRPTSFTVNCQLEYGIRAYPICGSRMSWSETPRCSRCRLPPGKELQQTETNGGLPFPEAQSFVSSSDWNAGRRGETLAGREQAPPLNPFYQMPLFPICSPAPYESGSLHSFYSFYLRITFFTYMFF